MLARKPQRTHAEFVSRHETVPATRVANVAKAPFADFFRHVAHASGMVWPIRLVSAEHVAKEGIMFKKVALTYYPVTDVTRARKFYEETLGLKSGVIHSPFAGWRCGWTARACCINSSRSEAHSLCFNSSTERSPQGHSPPLRSL
jgi:hypothetical protein